jgi:hypothetical protein
MTTSNVSSADAASEAAVAASVAASNTATEDATLLSFLIIDLSLAALSNAGDC